MSHTAVTAAGRYLRLDSCRDELRLRADGESIDEAAVFERVELRHGRVALLTLDGDYLAVRPDRDLSYGLYPERELSARAAFEEVLWPDGQVTLRSCELTYVTAGQGEDAAVVVNRVEAGPLERLRYAAVPAALVRTFTRSHRGASGHGGASVPHQRAGSDSEVRTPLTR